jgi:hypothetical protein
MNTAPQETAPEADPFDVDALRLGQSFDGFVSGRKVITHVPCRKPNKQTYIRVRPGEEWRVDTMMLELKDERELYLVAPEMRETLAGECSAATLFTYIDRQDNVYLWPIRLPDPGGRDNTYWSSARAAAQHAEKQWVRVMANPATKAYEVYVAENRAAFSEPRWPEYLSFKDILRLAFKDSMIDSPDHPICRRLRGLR